MAYIYTIISDDMQSYDLPGKTIKILEKLEQLERDDARPDLGIREKFKRVHAFIVDILGKETAREILGSDKLDDIDPSAITITAKKIKDAYDKPIDDYNSSRVQQTIEDIPLDKVTELIKVTDHLKDNSK